MKTNPVGWFEIYVTNMDRAKAFYQSVLQCELTSLVSSPELEMWAFPGDMSNAGATGCLARMNGFKPGNNSVLIYFSSDDCAKEEKRIVSAGGKIQKPKESIGEYGFITLGIDTEGNMFGVHSMK